MSVAMVDREQSSDDELGLGNHPFRILCNNQHPMSLTKLPSLRKHRCLLCRTAIPRSAPRHTCWWCTSSVCFDCGMQFAARRTKSTLPTYAKCTTLRSSFRIRMEQKQTDRELFVAISKYYDIVNPADGMRRVHSHSRKGLAIAEDCHFAAFSNAGMLMGAMGSSVSAQLTTSLLSPQEEAGLHGRSPPERGLDGHALALEVVQRGMELVGIVGSEVDAGQDFTDKRWDPQLPGTRIGEPRLGAQCGRLLSWLLGGGDVLGKLTALCNATTEVLKAQPVISEVPVPAKVFGDIHGQLRDLLLLFHFYGPPGCETKAPLNRASSSEPGDSQVMQMIRSKSSMDQMMRSKSSMDRTESAATSNTAQVSYVFNGDWVDRGRHQLEVVTLLLALKVAYPSLVWLNRGNHEDVQQNLKTSRKGNLGFDRACDEQLGHHDGPQAFAAFHGVFEWLPLAARVEEKILVLHGGLGSGEWTLDMLRSAERPLKSTSLASALDGTVYNILWSDPLGPDRKRPEKTFGVHPSARSKHSTVMKGFGRDVTERFCAREKIGLIIRSHQFKQSGKGYELTHDGWLMRVFSARNYCGEASNDGGLLLIGRAEDSPDTLLVRPQNVERMHRIKKTPDLDAFTSHLPEPYCPRAHLMQLADPLPPSGCLSLSRILRDLKQNVECNECGAEDLQAGCYYHCRACPDFDLCLECAARSAYCSPCRRHNTGDPEVVEDSSCASSYDGDSSCDSSDMGDDDAYLVEEDPQPTIPRPTLLTSGPSAGKLLHGLHANSDT